MSRFCAWGIGLGAAGLVAVPFALRAFGGPAAGATPVENLIVYAIDEDASKLVRWGFADDDYVVLGLVTDQNGNVVQDIECLGYIPFGPNKGFYGATNYPAGTCRLLKIDPLDGTATVYPVDVGFPNAEGMVAHRDPVSGQWTLLAVQSGGNLGQVTLCHYPPGNPGNAHTITVGAPAVNTHVMLHGDTLGPCPGDETPVDKNLISINPATGIGTLVVGLGARFEGLAQGHDGTLYAAWGKELWKIEPEASPVLTRMGAHAYGIVRSLEFAFGDASPGLDIPGVPAAWTSEGALFGFSDAANTLIVLNPATGAAVGYPSPLNATDCEGMVFLTKQSDPYHVILVGAGD